MTTDAARHYAEKVRDTLKAIAEADERNLDLLTSREFDAAKHELAAREARGLRSALLLHAANLAEAVLAETPPSALPAPHVFTNCEGTDPASCFRNIEPQLCAPTPTTRCGAEFAGHVCGRVPGHDPTIKHCDILTGQRW